MIQFRVLEAYDASGDGDLSSAPLSFSLPFPHLLKYRSIIRFSIALIIPPNPTGSMCLLRRQRSDHRIILHPSIHPPLRFNPSLPYIDSNHPFSYPAPDAKEIKEGRKEGRQQG